MLKEYLTNIANAIRTKLGIADKINARDFADKVTEVYDKGYDKGSYDVWHRWCGNYWIGHCEIPYGITKLGLCCFYYNYMASVTIPESVTTFENSVFGYCIKLKEVRLPSKLTFSSANVFGGCTELEKVTVGNANLTTITTGTFDNCNKLTTIIIESGMITQNWYCHQTPISVESMKHIIEHLTDFSSDETKAYKNTLKFSDTCWSALEADSVSPNGGTWKEYVDSLGWLT